MLCTVSNAAPSTPASPSAGSAGSGDGATRAQILVVDDEAHLRKLIAIILRSAGYDVITASSGVDALTRLGEALPDLVVSDVMMPELDGFGLLENMRANARLRAIPVIMLTAMSETDHVVQGLGLGADDYLAKPFQRAELLARVRAKIERPSVPESMLARDRSTGVLSGPMFAEEVRRESLRAGRGGAPGCVAWLRIDEMAQLQQQFGARTVSGLARQVADVIGAYARPLDVLGRDAERADAGRDAGRDAAGDFCILMPDTTEQTAITLLGHLSRALAAHPFKNGAMTLRLTAAIGLTTFSAGEPYAALREQALGALQDAQLHLDLVPRAYKPGMTAAAPSSARQVLDRVRAAANLPFQLLLVFLISTVLPFLAYTALDAAGYDITPVVYLIVVFALLATATLIWIEGFLALRTVHPPAEPGSPYPPATAIIAAYLPNEAATIVDTIEAFLRLDYPAPLQIILAYNTPRNLPVEQTLQEIARRDSRFVPLRVMNSTSKAQNVNTALARAQGEFVGIFDADHWPDPPAFRRAWRWLSNGADVVQGHCLARNGDESWVARLVAVEFEAIYAASHPGRARLYQFGVFGGSNGYWKTDILRATRMHGFMLTEDIDSSIRLTLSGRTIINDPLLVSRELAPVALKALWHQRMRWAQGWYQVSLKHLVRALLSPRLNLRQKAGIFWLLGWREMYPWIADQVFPLIAFWSLKLGGVQNIDWLVPIFVLTTLFTLSVGPGQTALAYLLADPEVRRRKGWFVFYLAMSSLFYTQFKNTIARVAQIKELMRERQWKVTPRAQTRSS